MRPCSHSNLTKLHCALAEILVSPASARACLLGYLRQQVEQLRDLAKLLEVKLQVRC